MRNTIRTAALLGLGACALAACVHTVPESEARPRQVRAGLVARPADFWNSATVYFLLIDRFQNGDTSNDRALGRPQDGAPLRSFMGGDLKGVLQKIESGYFDSLGVSVIWMTPFVEQVHGSVDEGQGKTYAYHGYWTRDWTAVDPAFGSRDDLRAVVDSAHAHHIRVLMDAVINHTGPVTPLDPQWPDEWVRTGPRCTYRSYVTTVDCTLVDNLPDIRTDRNEPVDLPPALIEKWRGEGRLERERASLDSFFTRTGYPRAPRYYLIKWLTDWVREFGIDGYRMDTAKDFEDAVAVQLKREARRAFADWKHAHPDKVLDSLPFYMVGEVYGWDPSQGQTYSYGDSVVNFFTHGYDGLINFGFKRDAAGPLDSVFGHYAAALSDGALHGVSFLNYVSSHDDGAPYDLERKDPLGAGSRLLLAPGGAQIYYGDELARPLRVAGVRGDANLRSFMNWQALGQDSTTRRILEHWRKLGRFRHDHPALGAGWQRMLQAKPYIFGRTLLTDEVDDRVVVAMDQPKGPKTIPLFGVFPDGTPLRDAYSGDTATVRKGAVSLTTDYDLVLLGQDREAAPNDSVIVYVQNDYALPMEAYVVGAGTDYRMGTVDPGIVSRFVLRSNMLSTNHILEFVAQATGYGPQARTGQLTVVPGDVVDFIIATNLIGTRAVVRP
ncbi:MAG: alpha-amylase family glycosyl hydrolase [Gemmatimonadales bacterium]